MDERRGALDRSATAKIEDLIHAAEGEVHDRDRTHNMQQAARVSDQTAFFYMASSSRSGPRSSNLHDPREQRTEDYVTGKFG